MLQPTSEEVSAPTESSQLSAITVDEGKKLEVLRETYSYDEVLVAALEYFNGDELAANTWATKYALKDPNGQFVEKTPEAMHRRLAKEFARIEKNYPNPMSEQEIFDLLDRFKYIVPQGSPMSGIGNPYKVQSISNCFVIDNPADSYGGILMTDQEQVQIMKRRGGVGFDLSTIRPKGLPTANAAHTTDGIEIFMDRFSNSCREVAQGGRRGALMLTLDVHHPQVRDFVKIKRDLKRVTGANISLRLSDEFMDAVQKDKEVHLRWPCEPGAEHVIEEWVSASELWEDIIESAHGCAEPGLLFWGNAKKYTPSDIYEEEGFGSVSTNPCLAGDTLVAVADGRGFVAFEVLAAEGKDVPVYCCDGHGEVAIRTMRRPRKTKENAALVKVTLDDGTVLRCTADHRFQMRDGGFVEAGSMNSGDSLHVGFRYEASPHDRWSRTRRNTQHDSFWLTNCNRSSSYGEHRLIWEAENGPIPKKHVVHHVDFDAQNNALANLQCMSKKDHDALHAEHMMGAGNPILQEAETVGVSRRVTATTSSDPKVPLQDYREITDLPLVTRGSEVLVEKQCEECEAVFHVPVYQREQGFCSHACSNTYVAREYRNTHLLGIRKGHQQRMGQVRHSQLEVYTRLQFDLERPPLRKEWEQVCKREKVPFGIRKKLTYGFRSYRELQSEAAGFNHRVVSVVEDGHADVFNGTVDEFHNFYIGGAETTSDKYGKPQRVMLNTLNCGEIILSPNDSCRLMVVNLSSFVTDAFTEHADFDWGKYQEVVSNAQRLMDDMIDLEIEQIDKILAKIEADPESEGVKAPELNLWGKIREAAVRGRRTGLGVTAVGDTVAMMGFRYGSEDSVEFVEHMYRALAVASYESSIDMAAERGCFPVYNFRKEVGHPFIDRVLEAAGPELRGRYETHGRRNIANTTTAPCGSVSILTQTTSGIEPAYTLLYTRRKKINPNDEGAKVDHVDDMGDAWSEFTVRHHGFVQWQEIAGKTDADIEESPYFGGTSNDVDWVQKVNMQGRAQKWICHAISSTTNLPHGTSVETVKEIYESGYKAGCKGVTIYRDGCRAGVLIQNKFVQHSAPKRPDRLPCEIHRSRIKIGGNGMQDWIFFVGMFEGKPFEVFGGTTEHIEIPKKIETGWVVKRSFKEGGKYDFYYGDANDPTKIKNIVNQFDNPDRGWATRMVSLSLRHGTPIHYVVEQLGRDKTADLFDFSKCIARVLKKYIADGTTPGAEKVCPSCGDGDNLRYETGCVTCHSCGHSKCA